MRRFPQLIPFLALTLVACTSGGAGGSGGTGNSGGGGTGGSGNSGGEGGAGALAPYAAIVWDYVEVDVDDNTKPAGVQGKLLRGTDGTVYYAYFKKYASVPSCDIAVFGGGTAPGVNYQLKVAVKGPADTAWSVETVPLENAAGATHEFISSLYGLDGVVEDGGAGALVLAVAAGAPGLATCGSSDLVLARRTAANTWTFQTPAAASAACCSDEDCNGDPACRSGTDVGAWATIAESPAGDLVVGYTDYHNFWDQDGQSMQGFELWDESTGGATGIRPWGGMGIYSEMVFAGDTALAAYAGYNAPGLWVVRREGTAGTPADWIQVMNVSGIEVGERISMAVAADGTVGLAFARSAAGDTDLRYCESADDGATWSTCVNVDDALPMLGYYPSLAFDNESRPLIAYRFCGVTSCENAYDGARLAWREHSGVWNTKDIYRDNQHKDGLYAQLVLDPETNEPVIAFQNQSRGAAVVAQGFLF